MPPKSSGRPAAKKATKKKGHPPRRRVAGQEAALAKIRRICLGLPDTHEKEAWAAPTFRVKGRMFAMFVCDHHGDGRLAIWCSAPEGAQQVMVASDPERYFVPPYVGPSGWLGVRLDRGLAWEEVAEIVKEGYDTIRSKLK